jgi:hypothetical protein
MPKKINNTTNLRPDGNPTGRGGGGGGGVLLRETRSKDPRINIGSFFSNESNQYSVAASTKDNQINYQYHFPVQHTQSQPHQTASGDKERHLQSGSNKPEYSNRMSSVENLSVVINDNEQNSESNLKHITFAGVKDRSEADQPSVNFNSQTHINQISTFETESSDLNINRLSAGAVVCKNGPATMRHDESGKSGSITQLVQSKRNSIKASSRRPSLKYRTEHRSHRSAMGSGGGNGASGVSFRRKLSHGNSLSFYTSEILGHDNESTSTVMNQNNASGVTNPQLSNADDLVEQITLQNNLSSPSINNGNVSFGPLSPTFTQMSDTTSQFNDYCEVDEIDYNRCFPWIKVD